MKLMDWREPTAGEVALIDRLLSATFTGKDAIMRQLRGARVRVVDAEGSLAFNASSSDKAVVKHRIPIEAEAYDRDGMTVHMLLHVVEGSATELEFYKDDSSPIIELPPPDQWRLVELHG